MFGVADDWSDVRRVDGVLSARRSSAFGAAVPVLAILIRYRSTSYLQGETFAIGIILPFPSGRSGAVAVRVVRAEN